MAQGKLTISIRDEKGATGTTEVELDYPDLPTEGRDSPLEYSTSLISLVDALVTGVIVGATLNERVPLPDNLKTVPQGKADVEEKGVFKWEIGGVPELVTFISLPTFREDLILDGTDRVDLEDAEVIAFIEMIVDPIDLTENWTVKPVDKRGVEITALQSAYERFKRRKRR